MAMEQHNPFGELLAMIFMDLMTAPAQCIRCRAKVAVYDNNWDHNCDDPGPTLLDLIRESRKGKRG